MAVKTLNVNEDILGANDMLAETCVAASKLQRFSL